MLLKLVKPEIDVLVYVALQGAVAAGGVRVQPASRLDSEVGGLLHRLDGKVPRRLDNDTSLAADPGDDRGAVFVVMAPPGLPFLPATPWLATQCFGPALLGLALMARRMVEVISFHRPVQLTSELIGEGGIAQPPTPAIAGPA